MSVYTAMPPNCEFVVNFSPELSEIICESCYMEKLGFIIPDLARNVALQEEKFQAYCAGLEHCLSRYHSLLTSLLDAEVCAFMCMYNYTCIVNSYHTLVYTCSRT